MRLRFFIIFFLFFFQTFLHSEIPIITSTTNITQDLIYNPSVSIITQKQIKEYGLTTIPDIINYIQNVWSQKMNSSTINTQMIGVPTTTYLSPVILIDGMEISENFYDRTFLDDLPVSISEIDKIEIVTNPTYPVPGYSNISGIINIVTKPSEFLNSNYVYQDFGSNKYKNTSASINKYIKLLKSYIKISGNIREKSQYDSHIGLKKFKLITIKFDKFTERSKFTIRSSYSKQDIGFRERLAIGAPFLPKKMLNIELNNALKNTTFKNILFDYKFKNFDISFYTQKHSGKIIMYNNDIAETPDINSDFYKLSIKKDFPHNNITIGANYRIRKSKIVDFTNMYRSCYSIYVFKKIMLFKNVSLYSYLERKHIKDVGNVWHRKFMLEYKVQNFLLNFGYSKTSKPSPMTFEYFNVRLTVFPHVNTRKNIIPLFNHSYFPVYVHGNKNLHNINIRSYTTTFTYHNKYIELKNTFFFNKINRIPAQVALPKIVNNNLTINVYNKNLEKITTHGSSFIFNYSKDFNLNTNFYLQSIENKRHKSNDTYFLPKTGFSMILSKQIYNFIPHISYFYHSPINFMDGNSTTKSIVNFGIYYKHKNFEYKLYIDNLFDNKYKEDPYGKKLSRRGIIEIKYNF